MTPLGTTGQVKKENYSNPNEGPKTGPYRTVLKTYVTSVLADIISLKMQNKQYIIFCWLAELNLMYLKDNGNLNTSEL